MQFIRDRVRRAKQIYKREGKVATLQAALRMLYKPIRPLLPAGEYPNFRGITVCAETLRPRPLDDIFGHGLSTSTHKKANTDLVQTYVDPGDTVCIIGGGYGITAVTAAKVVQNDDGEVKVYEGAAEQVGILRKTVESNGVSDQAEIDHAIVGDPVELKGISGEAERIKPEELPECDVLEMDCEGAELKIISNLMISPSKIIVESHPSNGSSTEAISKKLLEKGYEIVDMKPDPVSGDVIVASLPH